MTRVTCKILENRCINSRFYSTITRMHCNPYDMETIRKTTTFAVIFLFALGSEAQNSTWLSITVWCCHLYNVLVLL